GCAVPGAPAGGGALRTEAVRTAHTSPSPELARAARGGPGQSRAWTEGDRWRSLTHARGTLGVWRIGHRQAGPTDLHHRKRQAGLVVLDVFKTDRAQDFEAQQVGSGNVDRLAQCVLEGRCRRWAPVAAALQLKAGDAVLDA